MKNVPTNLCNLKSEVDKLDVNKLAPFPVDLSKLSDVVKNDVKNDVCNAKIKNIENIASLNVIIKEVKVEVPNITNLATTTALTAVEKKMPDVNNLVKKKLVKLKIKLLLIMIMINILLLKNLIS